jgi:probable rRNA maturation factor
LLKKVVVLEPQDGDAGTRTLLLFAARAQRAVGLRGEVSIRVTTSAELQRLNRRFRHKNKPTDVLSFPSEVRKVAGDIAISSEIATHNAAELGHSRDTELKILILHGLLHLAGYDHENDCGEMGAKEIALRRKFRLPSGLIERTVATGTNGTAKSRPRASAARVRRGSR